MHLSRRRLWIGILVLICIASLFVVAGSYAWGWTYGLPVKDDSKMATINTVAVLASLIVVALAGVVAILAYAIASGQPDLKATITFNFSEPNQPRFLLSTDAGGLAGLWRIEPFKQVSATVLLENSSRYAARNPGIRIKFDGISGLGELPGWETAVFTHMIGVTEIQWDGGADRIIHGEWSRNLPGINLQGTSWMQHVEKPTMTVTVVADGLSPKSAVYPIKLVRREEEEAAIGEPAPTVSAP